MRLAFVGTISRTKTIELLASSDPIEMPMPILERRHKLYCHLLHLWHKMTQIIVDCVLLVLDSIDKTKER